MLCLHSTGLTHIVWYEIDTVMYIPNIANSIKDNDLSVIQVEGEVDEDIQFSGNINIFP